MRLLVRFSLHTSRFALCRDAGRAFNFLRRLALFLEITLLAIALSIDGFALCAGWALAHGRSRKTWLLPVMFAVAQPLIVGGGWLAGDELRALIGPAFRYAAGALLGVVGARMAWQAWREGSSEADAESSDDRDGGVLMLIGLVIASNIDAVFAGLASPHLAERMAIGLALMAVIALIFGVLGALIGRKLGERFGSRAAIFGGLVLIALGVHIAL